MQIYNLKDHFNYNFNHLIVRDLAWAIASSPLLVSEHDELLTDDWFQKVYLGYLPRLYALDNQPGPLLAFMNKTNRLGFYFEKLWHFFFIDHRNFEVLLAHHQVNDGKQTLGEFDFVVRDIKSGRVTHYEVAVKFYLGYQLNKYSTKYWYGANMNDRLDIKLNHMLDHQSKLSTLPSTKQLLNDLNINIDDTRIILKGRLYLPHNSHSQSINAGTTTQTDNTVTHHCQWMTTQTFLDEQSHFEWFSLDKLSYLAPRRLKEVCPWPVERAKTLEHPVQLLRFRDSVEAQRLFVVPEKWLANVKNIASHNETD